MAVQLDMSTTPFRRKRGWFWQPALAALLLLAFGREAAMADKRDRLVYMKQGLYIRALIEFEDPAKAGDPVAEADLGAIYYYGLGVSANFAKAAQYYHAAALEGNLDAQLGLGVIYATTRACRPVSPSRACGSASPPRPCRPAPSKSGSLRPGTPSV